MHNKVNTRPIGQPQWQMYPPVTLNPQLTPPPPPLPALHFPRWAGFGLPKNMHSYY